jgi:HAD superfamily hydrolase (TIGR01509 family)
MIKAILFDFNGVIVNDEPLHMKAFQEVFGGRGIEITQQHYLTMLGMDDRTFTRAVIEHAGQKPGADEVEAVLSEKGKLYQQMIATDLPMFDGVVNFVKSCSNKFTMGIVSMARRADIEAILKRAGLSDCFDAIVSAEDVTRCKPDPQGYKKGFVAVDAAHAAKGNRPICEHECLVVEDSPPGVEAAKTVGLKVLAVSNTVGAAPLREAGALMVTNSLADWTPEAVAGAFR